ncbi:MAG: CPBP family intramembrane metalloprotease [Candidatus Dormibacteraeota bacterium]|nr:CPBP family intramembrane metalloprotease [Candidatus Dormibacteraeota bacterium]
MSTLAVLLVLIGLYVLANFGERSRTARILTLIAGGSLAGLALLAGLLLALFQALRYSVGQATTNQLRASEEIAIPIAVAGLLGLLLLVPAVQRGISRVLPLRARSPVAYITLVIGILFLAQQLGSQLAVNVLDALKNSPPLTVTDLLFQDIPLLLLAFFAVGLFIRRSFPETLNRLGLVPPPARYWWLVALLAIPVFMGVAYGIEWVAGVVTPATQKEVTDVSTVLFSRFNNPAAIIFLGLLAGVVEEIVFRGALMPRLGILVTALLFAALHTQYGITFASLEVFVLGVGLGWLRVRSGTLTCIVAHAGYDIAVGLLPLIFK